MIKKIGFLLLLMVLIISCKKKMVKLAKVPLQGKTEITNHSQIWMFYNDKNKGLDLNEKNRISSTNWLFNIDKRLKLKEVIPAVVALVKKHNKKSPHNTEPMANYYSYANTLNNKLSFYAFDSIRYKFIGVNKLPKFVSDTALITISNATLMIIDSIKQKSIQIAIYENASFEDYLSAKAKINKVLGLKQILNTEYIITE